MSHTLTVTKTCEQCKKEFSPDRKHPHQEFCSRLCQGRNWRARHIGYFKGYTCAAHEERKKKRQEKYAIIVNKAKQNDWIAKHCAKCDFYIYRKDYARYITGIINMINTVEQPASQWDFYTCFSSCIKSGV